MAKQQPQRRPSNPPQQQQAQQPKKAAAPVRKSETRENIFSAGSRELIFGRQNFIFMGIGLALVLAGLLAMAGGAQPDPNNWDPNLIYSFRRITLAPILMIAGFVVVAYGIFKKASVPAAPDDNKPAA